MIGVSHEGKKYTYDARKIAEKLKKGDYSNDGKKMVFLTKILHRVSVITFLVGVVQNIL